ncbi:hypothetical protein X797_000833 [Metarhizium robertsii]|uniref:Uncharacterized protein n=2 Tax=Metarhizium robertsii TaxID=568076 RepID=E9EQZ7_METRA|nr:uncharacterized protein MAA_02446 [Metarhizium robertsii ARSEF 23]EFZ02864.1 hypothetical protein MAA_02446 [Metarhizium robertsii ARSEF 23]EXV06116.1 hypothetical protein X797_000833 [Metarhizium robertsii]
MQRPRPPSASTSPHSRAGPDGAPRSASRARWHMSPSPSPSPSRSRTPSQSRSPSRSTRRSASRPPPRRSSRDSQQEKEHNRGRLIKDSAGLLLGIGVAAVVAHKFWPKGMLYGAKEEWETRLDKARDKVLGDDNGRGPDVRRRERGRSMNRGRAYHYDYESERLAVERGPAAPSPRSRSCRERVPRGRSLGPLRRRVYQEAADTARWERPGPGHRQQGRGEPLYASEGFPHLPDVDLGHRARREDDFTVVERDLPRHGGRGYR